MKIKNQSNINLTILDRTLMKFYCRLFAMAICPAFVLTGCTGPQMMTHQPSSSHMTQSIPAQAKLFIAITCDDSVASSAVHAKLCKALLKTGKFSSVEFGNATPGSLQMNIEIKVKRSSWDQRAFTGDFSYVSATGSIVSGTTTLAVIHEVRSGSGGLAGTGGWATTGENSMITGLTDWLIEDIASSFIKAASRSTRPDTLTYAPIT